MKTYGHKDNYAQGDGVLAEQGAVGDVEDYADDPGGANTPAAWQLHCPEDQDQREPVGPKRLGTLG